MQLAEMPGPGGVWRVLVPETRRERMRGLRGHPPLRPREAMLLRRCRTIQTFGLRQTITVAFLGPISRAHCVLPDGQEVEAQISSTLAAALSPQDRVTLTVAPDPVLVVGP